MKSLSWKSHPARERPIVAIVVVLFILAIFYLVFDLSGSGVMVLVAAMIFFFSLSTFFFPTFYMVDEKQVIIKYLFNVKSRNLSAFRSLYPGRRGVLLSPYLSPTRIENFRGFYLRYGENNRVEVDKFLAELLEAQMKAPDPETEGS